MRAALPSSCLENPRLAAFAVSVEPAWLWSADGLHVLWANAAGAAAFGETSVGALTARQFNETDRTAQEIVRVAQSLTPDAAPRLERLDGFGAGSPSLECVCSRITLKDDTPAILVRAVSAMQPALSLAERAQRLIGTSDEALAVFAPAGDLIHATPAAQQRIASTDTFAGGEATALAIAALRQGESLGLGSLGPVSFWQIGQHADTLYVVQFDVASQAVEPQAATSAPQPAPQPTQPEPLETPTPPESAEATKAAGAEPQPLAPIGEPDADRSKVLAQAVASSGAGGAIRRHPLRFVWQMDVEERFTLMSDEFIAMAGSATAGINGARWNEFCATLDLDPENQVAHAIATRDTWSGIVLSWPTAGGEAIKVELSGLPIFDRQRAFIGYRGFGVCRDVEHIDNLARNMRPQPAPVIVASAEPPTPLPPQEVPRPLLSLVPSSANVVPFPAALPADPRAPGLNAGDRKAFSDIAQQLAARLKSNPRPDVVEPRVITTVRPSQPLPPAIDGRAPAVSTSDDIRGEDSDWLAEASDARALLDRLPVGVLIYRAQELLYANRVFLDGVGFVTLAEFAEGGGLDNLLLESAPEKDTDAGARTISIVTADGTQNQADARLISVPYCGEPALALVLLEPAGQEPGRASIRDRGRDRSVEKILEQQIADVRREAGETIAEHVEFLTRFARDIRTPLTAIMGFAETILSERFGPIGNERYRDYLSGIRNAGGRILALVDESGRTGDAGTTPEDNKSVTAAAAVDLNETVRTCVSELQQDAARNRVLIRTALASPLPSIAAEGNAVRQIVLNLMTNSIKLAGAGGQVIISTGVNVAGTVLLRLRDTGIGVDEEDVAAAMQRDPAQGEMADGAEGRLKLAVAKALLEANRASLKVSSKPNDGTLVEVSFREVAPAA